MSAHNPQSPASCIDRSQEKRTGTEPSGLWPVPELTRAERLYSQFAARLQTCFPVCCQLLGNERWRPLIQAFLSNYRCKLPTDSVIAGELIEFLRLELSAGKLPEFIIDLAHFEWVKRSLETERVMLPVTHIPIKNNFLSCIPAFNPVLRRLRYHYPVQHITGSDPSWEKWPGGTASHKHNPVILAGFRDTNNAVQFAELNAMTDRLIELLQQGRMTGKQALLQLATDMRFDDPDAMLWFGTGILRQLAQLQIIIGAQC